MSSFRCFSFQRDYAATIIKNTEKPDRYSRPVDQIGGKFTTYKCNWLLDPSYIPIEFNCRNKRIWIVSSTWYRLCFSGEHLFYKYFHKLTTTSISLIKNELKVSYLALIGGFTKEEVVRGILRRIFSQPFACQISYSGKGNNKLAFKDFPQIHKLVFGKLVVLQIHKLNI